jgi:uncharacterized YigZ family protein
MESDTYLTIRAFSEGLYKEKGSRFLSFAYPVRSPEEIKQIITDIRKLHHSARHHCYAWMIGPERESWRINDDGEPSGTAGKPILGQINSFGLTNILIVVTRYFGGKLLGAAGLINAYRAAAEDAIRNSQIIELTVRDHFELVFPWPSMNEVMKLIKEENLSQSDQLFDTDCRITIGARCSIHERVVSALERIEGLRYTFSGRH